MKKQQRLNPQSVTAKSPQRFTESPQRLPEPSKPVLERVRTLRTITSRMSTCLLATLLSALVGIGSVQAQVNGQERGNEQAQENAIKLNLQDVDIRVLINTVAEVSGKNFIVDPRVKGKVSVISGKSVSPEELYDYFLAILEVHNFATVGTGNVIKVLPSNVIKQKPTTTLFQPTTQENDEQVTQIIQLQHASVQDLVAIIRPLIPPTSHFAPHVASNSVILTDTAANIQRVLKIIRRIDIPDKRSNTHVVYLNKTKATDMANSLTQLVASTGDPKEAAAGRKLSIQPFDAINALVISATDEQFARVKALIDELDVERDIAGDVSVIALKHANAEDLVSILNDVTATNVQGAPSELNVQADEASNSLIVRASGSQLKTVESVVGQLDKRRAQVFVETIIAEVQLDQGGSLGISFNAGVDAQTSEVGRIIDSRVNRVGSRSGTGLVRTGSDDDGNYTGLTYNLIDFGRYQLDVVLNALRTDTNSNVLSTPTILTQDNEEAEIIVGQEVPFVTGVFNNGLATNTGGDTDEDGDGATRTTALGTGFQTIERKDVGIKLKIKPQINDGDTITMEVFQETSGVVPSNIEGVSDVVTNRRSIETVVQVDDGQIVALGGLITDDFTNTEERVPVLGSIPVIGRFFRNTRKRATKRNLMVFLKPQIIRTPSDLETISRKKYEEVRHDEASYANKADDPLVLPEAEPAILVDYDSAVNEGVINTESRARDHSKGLPKKSVNRKIKDIIFGRKTAKSSDSEQTNEIKKITNLEAEAKAQKIVDEIERQQRNTAPVINLSSQPDNASGGGQ